MLFKKSYNLSINSTNTFLYLFELDCYSKITFRFLLNSNTKSSETAGLTWNNLWPLLLFNQNLSYKVHICKRTEVINKNIHKYIDNLFTFLFNHLHEIGFSEKFSVSMATIQVTSKRDCWKSKNLTITKLPKSFTNHSDILIR